MLQFFFSLSQKSQINLSSFLVARYLFMTDGIAKLIVIVEFSLMKHVFRDWTWWSSRDLLHRIQQTLIYRKQSQKQIFKSESYVYIHELYPKVMQFFISSFWGKTFFKWYIFHKSLFVWYLSFAKRPDIRKFTRFVERFLIIFFEIIFLVAFNGNYQFVNLQKTIVSPLFNICIMKAVKNVPFCCSRT